MFAVPTLLFVPASAEKVPPPKARRELHATLLFWLVASRFTPRPPSTFCTMLPVIMHCVADSKEIAEVPLGVMSQLMLFEPSTVSDTETRRIAEAATPVSMRLPVNKQEDAVKTTGASGAAPVVATSRFPVISPPRMPTRRHGWPEPAEISVHPVNWNPPWLVGPSNRTAPSAVALDVEKYELEIRAPTYPLVPYTLRARLPACT